MAALGDLRSCAEPRVLTGWTRTLGVPFGMLNRQNSHQKRIGSALYPDSPLRSLASKRTSGEPASTSKERTDGRILWRLHHLGSPRPSGSEPARPQAQAALPSPVLLGAA